MSKARKRCNNLPDLEQCSSLKKIKKAPGKQCVSLRAESSPGKSSEFPAANPSPKERKTTNRGTKSRAKSSAERKKPENAAKKFEVMDVKSLNVSQLLDLGEEKSEETPRTVMDESEGSSDEGDWEEVDMEVKTEPIIPKEGVNITVELPELKSLKKKKKGFDLEAHIKRQMNQVRREVQLLIHKVHILCWIAHIKFVNKVLNSETLLATSLSLISNKNLYPPKYSDLNYLQRIVKWFYSIVELKEFLKNPMRIKELSEQLCHNFSIKTAYSKKQYVLMFVVMCRTLGLKTRLVMSFQVVPIRPKMVDLKPEPDRNDPLKKEDKGTGKDIDGEVKIVKVENSIYFSEKIVDNTPTKAGTSSKKLGSKITEKEDEKNVKNVKISKVAAKGKRTKTKKMVKSVPEDSDSDESMTSKHFKNINEKSKMRTIKLHKRTSGSAKEESPSKKTPQIKGKSKKNAQDELKLKRSVNKGKVAKSKVKITPELKNKIIEKASQSSDTDSDFLPQSLKTKGGQVDVDRRVFSSDDDGDETSSKKKGVDVWAEVFLESEEKWICVDAPRMKIHCVNELYSRATQPVVYIIACNNDSTLKDVTKRYVPNWHSDTRKRRVDEEWWNNTMWPYQGPKTPQEREEDEDIRQQLMDKPLPASINEYKDHPLYALKRHLLKFEGIYPPEAPTLGFVKGEPVYARECVVTLRSREVWYKEARVVRLQEEPYKIVKARPKYDKMTGEFKKDLPLELFGFWQTDEFIPPIASNGKVPRNEYGNVDLFKPCMLPKGTVHLQIPNLNKVAKKLGIDCAAAVTGFEFHSGASHPVTDGFVVCEEFKDVLLDAWNEEVDESNKKNEEKRMKRIYDNWKRLIRGLLIREKLKMKYAFGNDSENQKASTSGKKIRKKDK